MAKTETPVSERQLVAFSIRASVARLGQVVRVYFLPHTQDDAVDYQVDPVRLCLA